MKSFAKSLFILSILFLPVLHSCSDSSNEQMEEENPIKKGNLSLKITDAAIDDEQISGVFITFSGVKLDTQIILFDNKVTLDIHSLQNGETAPLLNDSINIGTYTNLELLVDYDTDAQGNRPGNYVLDNVGVKHNLKTDAPDNLMVSLHPIDGDIKEGMNSEWIVDIDLRKAIQYESEPTAEDKYAFYSDINSSLRIVDDNHFMIQGFMDDSLNVSGDETIVFIYRKGEFNIDSEVNINSDIQFKDAITSTMVDDNGKFEIHFLKSGEYEIKLVSFDKMDDGSMEAKGIIEVTSPVDVNILDLNLDSNLEINLTATAVTPF